MTEDEMVGWHQRLNGREFEQTPGVGDAPGEDPGPSGHGSLDQAFPEDLLQLGLHLKVLKAPMHGY